MRLFRDNIGLGSWLALIALALNLALSFGHVHAIGGQHRALIATAASPDGGPTGHHNDGLTDDRCPICMAASAIGTALASAPPELAKLFAVASLDRTIEPILAVIEQQRAAFRSRAPPMS
jgi:hypothetical protein